jgi:hypothetical protein
MSSSSSSFHTELLKRDKQTVKRVNGRLRLQEKIVLKADVRREELEAKWQENEARRNEFEERRKEIEERRDEITHLLREMTALIEKVNGFEKEFCVNGRYPPPPLDACQ